MRRLERIFSIISGGLLRLQDSRLWLWARKVFALGFLLLFAAFGVFALGPPSTRLTPSLTSPFNLSNPLFIPIQSNPPHMSSDILSTVSLTSASGSNPDSIFDLRIFLALILGAVTSFLFNFAWTTLRTRGAARGSASGAAAAAPQAASGGVAGPGNQTFDIPDNACYFCIRRAATSKCGSCRLVYYCCRLCQMQAWRKHRHVCGAAAAAATRIHRTRSLITPSQWRDLVEYSDYVKSLVPSTTVVPTAPEMVARILHKIGGYIRQRPELVCQPMADAVWASALSMRSEGLPDRLHMAWAWGFLEASVESGSADAFLAALRINDAGAADLPRVNRWMKRGLCQALLMLNKRQEVGGFFRAAPMQQLLYF